MKKAIYEVRIAHRRYGTNWSSTRVLARDVLEAIKKAKLKEQEIVEEVRLLARTD